MKAIGYKTPSPISAADSFVDIELPKPEPKGRDILVEVKAISVNPVDYKVRGRPMALNGKCSAGTLRESSRRSAPM